MKKYDFDEEIDRHGTSCIKYDRLKQDYGREDLLPLWIADMDFRTPDFIIENICRRCHHEVLGYTFPPESYYKAITCWVNKKHHWKIKREWTGFVPGIVPGLAHCIHTFTVPGDKILIQPPVYPPFHHLVENNGRRLVFNPLRLENGQFRMDLKDLEEKLKCGCRMMILCNPHNPGGRVWTPEELREVALLCKKYHTLVISDEIHADLTLWGSEHTPFGSVCKEARHNSIMLMAPSKTFNMAGIHASFFIAPDPELRQRLRTYMENSELDSGHIFAFDATRAAYENGSEWLGQVCRYIEGNIRFTCEFLQQEIPGIKAIVPEASFLIWLDCRELNLSQKELIDLFVNKARLALNDGETFGAEGRGFMRLNIGTSRITLAKALNRLKTAVGKERVETV